MAKGLAKDEVDRATEAVGRGIGRLVALLGSEDRAVIEKAALALDGLGAAAAVGPLADALPRARSPRHRMVIIAALHSCGAADRAAVSRALTEAIQRERDPRVQAVARAALTRMIMSDIAATAAGGPGASPAA